MDITSFSRNGAPPTETRAEGRLERQWWKLDPDKAASAIEGLVRFLVQNQSARQLQLTISARLYGNASIFGMPKVAPAAANTAKSVSYNVVQSGIDTATSKIAKNKPKPFFLTNGGNHDQQKKAKKLNKFIEGVFYEQKAYDKGPIAFRDGGVWGDGILHVFAEHGRIKWERVLPHELIVDELEALAGDPRSQHRVRAVDRGLLMELYPKKAEVIRGAKEAAHELRSMLPNVADLVTVRESWHLPSGPEAEDGKHIITIDGHALTEMEDYKKQRFPFARFQYCPRLCGYWSQGAAEQVQGIQLEINALRAVVQKATKLSGAHYWLIENGSKVAKSIITNAIGSIIPYTGPNKPEVVTPPIIPQEIYQQIAALKQDAYEQMGISQLSAASAKPAGLNSGAALREYNDIESDRFQTIGHSYESFMLDLAALSISVAKDIAEEEGDYEVKTPAGRFLRSIKWNDVALDEADYVMQCFPVSSLPNEPAGRLQTVQELVQAGAIPQSMLAKLMQFPDLEQYESLANAMEDRLEELFDAMVDEGEYSPPEPWFDPRRARELALQYILRGETQDLADERLEMLHTFLSQLDVLEQGAAQVTAANMAASPQASGATPQAQPAQPPQSDMLPFAA